MTYAQIVAECTKLLEMNAQQERELVELKYGLAWTVRIVRKTCPISWTQPSLDRLDRLERLASSSIIDLSDP